MPPRPAVASAPAVGRFTGIVLGLVVFVCVAMIGGAGYLKYQLDRAEAMMAAPDTISGSAQDELDHLRRALGYGGFLTQAQKYALAHDASGFADMKAEIKTADDIAAHLPDKTPAETRRELAAIVASFDAALQKISAPVGEANEFAAADLAPLYAALPILDARLSSIGGEAKLAAQSQLQFWAMLLTLVSWCSLIIAAACAAGIYLTLRDKHAAPMRALAQSIQNMARGDMRAAIWGIERQDMIGELARAVDIARYHFSHLPDISLLSDQGPVRMRFEGGSRSLFEAMMSGLSRDSEALRQRSGDLAQAMQSQQENLARMSAKIDHVMQNILRHGQNGDQHIRQAIQEMVGSADQLKNAHAHAADQLNRLIPMMQDRAQGMAEIAHIAGRQIGQSLQSLAGSEAAMKANAEQAKATLDKLSGTADDLGERLFGAINLLQASGKVLAEATQNMPGALPPELSSLPALPQTATLAAAALTPLQDRLDHITQQLAALQDSIETRDRVGTDRHSAINTDASRIESALRDLDGRLGALSASMPELFQKALSTETQTLTPQHLNQALQTSLQPLAASLQALLQLEKEAAQPEADADLRQLGAQIGSLRNRIEAIHVPDTLDLSAPALAQLQGQWRHVADQIEASRAGMAQAIADTIAAKLDGLAQALDMTRQAVDTITADIHHLAQRPAAEVSIELPTDMLKKLDSHWYQMAAQIEASRASLLNEVSAQIAQMEHKLSGKFPDELSETVSDYATQRQIEQQTQILSELVATLGALDAHMQQIKSDMRAGAYGRGVAL